jgi:hypothetical protein
VCLRFLAERFIEDQCHLYYERTALMAADIYTKAFSTPSEWDHALRLINHLDPVRFWEGRPSGPQQAGSEHMGSVHKGGVVFDYWVHNPWHGRLPLDVPVPEEAANLPTAASVTPFVRSPNHDDDDDFEDRDEGDYDDYACDETDDNDDTTTHDDIDQQQQQTQQQHQQQQPQQDFMYASPCTPLSRRRRIVEFCTSSDSRIGKLAPPNCEVVRLTIDDDLTSTEGLARALEAVSDPNFQVLLFGALPCTGGSQWQNINWRRGANTRHKIRSHWDVFEALFSNLRKVAAACSLNGGHIAIEWPRACAYWRRPAVKSFLRLYALVDYDFDGCMFGLCSTAAATLGNPIKKPWRIASNMPEFANLRLICTHTPSEHASCAGVDTKASEGYTDALAMSIHACFALHEEPSGPGGTALPLSTLDEYVVDF